jgi:hypothetical protein
MSTIRETVRANRTRLINDIVLDGIFLYFKQTKHWSEEMFTFFTDEAQPLRLDELECARILIDG